MEIPDAYQEYLAARRENGDSVKMATLVLPVTDLAAVWKLVAEAVDSAEELPVMAAQKWESILRSLASSIQGAV